jgi:carbon-monoxide dehydrogenase medium subunit
MKPAPFEYLRAASVEDAIRNLRAETASAKLIAGGQSLGPMLNLRLARPSLLIDIAGLPELTHVADSGGTFFVGAAVTHAQIEDRRVSDGSAGLMPAVAKTIAYRAVRNRGTIGGSLAHADPAADWLLALTALDAKVVIAGSSGQRKVPLGSFMIAPFTTALEEDELLTGVEFPTLSRSARFGHRKLSRKVGKFADAAAVIVLDGERDVCRVVIGRPEGPPVLLGGLSDLLLRSRVILQTEIAKAIEQAVPDLDAFELRTQSGNLAQALTQVNL